MTSRQSSRYDVAVAGRSGAIVLVRPCSPRGRDWFRRNVEAESWQYVGDALAVDVRYADDLIDGAADDGMAVLR